MHWWKNLENALKISSSTLLLFFQEQLAPANLLFGPLLVFTLEWLAHIFPHRLIEAMNRIVI